ncbi:MAG: hypothetical protein WCG87_04915 [Bacteroidota bacterium]
MSSKDHEQEIARQLYIHSRLTQPQIAEKLGVHRNSIQNWARDGKWTVLRNKHRQMPAILVEDLYHELQEINDRISKRKVGDRIPTVEETTIRRNIVATIRQLKQNSSLSEMKEAFVPLIDIIKYSDPGLVDTIKNYTECVIDERITEQSLVKGANNNNLYDEYCDDEEMIENEQNSAPAA